MPRSGTLTELPGNLGWDPLGLGKTTDLRTEELTVGRIAMLGIAGAMFAEGQTGETLAQQFENLSFSIV